MDKTIEILERSVKYSKIQLVENWNKLNEEEKIFMRKGLQETLNFIELLKDLNKRL